MSGWVRLAERSDRECSAGAAGSLQFDAGIDVAGGTPDDLKSFSAAEIQKWAPIIKAAKIEF